VSIRYGGDRKSSSQIVGLDMRDAEKLTGISNQLVSRWRKRLENREKYRERMIIAAYRE